MQLFALGENFSEYNWINGDTRAKDDYWMRLSNKINPCMQKGRINLVNSWFPRRKYNAEK